MSTTTPQSTKDTQKDNVFTAKHLVTFSPYQVIGIETQTKRVSGTRKTDNGQTKEYDFDSKNHTLTIIPQKNTSVTLKVNVFDQEYQNMLAEASLYDGFSKCIITTSIDPSSTSRKLTLIHKGMKKA